MHPMKMLLLPALLSALLTPLPAQCVRGVHPIGVTSVLGATSGCNEIDGTGRTTWFSMFAVPSERGGSVSFSYRDTPSAGVRPAFAVGYLSISGAVAVPGIRVPRTTDGGCLWHVPFDLLIPELVPLWPGCQVRQLGNLPPLPGLAGLVFYAQVWAQDLTNGKAMVTNPIRVTVQR
jgi:hypothetical protein